MKSIFTLLSFSFFILIASSSCNQYRSLTTATKVSQLSANPFMYNLSKSILKNTVRFMVEKELKNIGSKINLLTPLNSVIANPSQQTDFISMLTDTYKIPNGKLAKTYSSLSSMKDLIYFIANQGQKFNFYN